MNFWATTGAYDKVATYIDMNFEGLKDDVISMIAGGTCPVRVTKFSNDMHDIKCKDDVLTVLIHLGYLAYNPETRRCYIPNFEVKQEMENAVEDSSWRNVDKPAIVLELKYKKDVDAAIDQIKRKKYVSKIEQYTGDILLVGINYDKKEKLHSCVIETVTKNK